MDGKPSKMGGLWHCYTHINSPVTRHWRLAVILLGRGMQQASELVTALTDFARGDEQIILADVSLAMG